MIAEISLFRVFVGTAGLRIIGRGLSLVIGIIIARLLGPEEFGRYSFVISIITLMSLPAIAGIPTLVVRETARYMVDSKFGLMFGFWRWATVHIMTLSLLPIFFVLVAIWVGLVSENLVPLILIGIVLVPIKGLLVRLEASINGLNRPVLAQVPMVLVAPLILIVTLALCFTLDVSVDSQLLFMFQAFIHFVAVAIGWYLLNKLVNSFKIVAQRECANKEWTVSLIPLTLLAVIGTLNSELAIIVLGILGNEESIAYFKIALQGIALIAIGLQAVNTVTGPRITTMYKQGKLQEVQKLIKQSVRLSLISSVPFALLVIFFGGLFVKALFGEAYYPAARLLTILCVGQIVNVCMGSVGLILDMTGNEKKTLRAQVITLVLTLMLLLILVPLFQAVGAAIAVSVGLATWNAIMAFDVFRLTGLKPWIH